MPNDDPTAELCNIGPSRIEAFQAGPDFLAKPVERSELRARVRNLLRTKEYHDIVIQHSRTLKSEVQERTAQL